jgi:hypothetical protein
MKQITKIKPPPIQRIFVGRLMGLCGELSTASPGLWLCVSSLSVIFVSLPLLAHVGGGHAGGHGRGIVAGG